ncbi:hypothetical protein RA8CHR_05876 [Variovorax sp. RA8]|nr:hypothetical protein RA8CHR_05876 [Variovorax sp. RA8]
MQTHASTNTERLNTRTQGSLLRPSAQKVEVHVGFRVLVVEECRALNDCLDSII